MEAHKSDAPVLGFVRPDDGGERLRIHACNRILLYARGLNLDAATGLRLATESLDRAGPDASLESVFRCMHDILRDSGITSELAGRDGRPLVSFPPVKRTSMVSSGHAVRSCSAWLWSCAASAVAWTATEAGKRIWKKSRT